MNIPITITFLRIAAIPFFVLCFYLPYQSGHTVAALIFGLAAFTDWLDGYLARSLAQMTKFGAFLDPVADKLLVVTALILVVGEVYYQYNAKFLAIPAAIIVCREITICALREWMAQMGRKVTLSVIWVAKMKTTAQMLALLLLIAYKPYYPKYLLHVGCVLLYVAAVLTLWSMWSYLKAAWPDLALTVE